MEITLRPQNKQHLAYEALRTDGVDTVFFGGGAGGGKTWWLCEKSLVNAIRFPGYKTFIGREELKRLMQSTFVTFTKVCRHHDLPDTLWKLNGQYNYIEFANGSRIDLLDLKKLPTDPLYERFGSLEYTDGNIEEAGEIDFGAYDVLKTRIGRHFNKEFDLKPTMSITGNPKKNWTYTIFYKPWKSGTLPDNIRFIQSLYTDNEHTSESYGKQLLQVTDKATKQRLMYGNWEYDDDPTTMIDFEAIVDMYTNAVDGGTKYITADVARYGSDKTVIVVWDGLIATHIVTKRKLGVDEVSAELRDIAVTHSVPYSHILADEDGIGGGVVDTLRGIKGFMGNRTPFDDQKTGKPANFQNLKAQCTYLLAEYVNNRKIAVRCDDEEVKALLTEELEQIKTLDADKDGKLKILGKEKIKEIIGRSPDYSDCLMMRMFFELEKAPEEEESFVPQPSIRNSRGYIR